MSKDLRKIYRTAVSAESLPETISLIMGERHFTLHKISWKGDDEPMGLRYGTNPHQAAAIYKPDDPEKIFFGGMNLLKSGKNGLSATNVEDGYRALRIVNYFSKPAAAVMKHLNPSGVGVAYGEKDKLAEIFEKAWNGDSRAAYGSVVGFSVPIDKGVAENILQQQKYVECLFAPGCAPEALKLLEEKRDLRIVEVPKADKLLDSLFPYEIKVFGDVILLEQPFYTKLRSIEDLSELEKDKKTGVVTKRAPTEQERRNLLYAWWVCCEKRSNGVVIWKRDKVLGVGTGQQDRIGAIEIALARAERCDHDLKGSVLASDGYMLWDNVDPLAEAGVTAVIQPGGSVSDKELIEKCNQYDITMIFTGERVFRHF
jgi:phosphoribosylaminoimidazolecarboxamide formyltransferase/IMP cyclohydrolase